MKYLYVLAFLGVFTFFCGGSDISDFDRTLNGISSKTGKQVQSEFDYLTYMGVGGSLDKNNVINYESLDFSTKGEIDRDEGVKIVARVIETYLKNIYSEEKMVNYLKEHPFTYKNLEITIYVHDKNGNDVYHPRLWVVYYKEGIIEYKTKVKIAEYTYKKVSDIEEPFIEAAKRVGVWTPPES